MSHPSPDTPNDRIWSQPPTRPTGPADPALHDLVHDLDHAWDLPIPYALTPAAKPPRGVQPRVEFTTSGPTHPALRLTESDAQLGFLVHIMALQLGMVCGCGLCHCATCTPRPGAGGAR